MFAILAIPFALTSTFGRYARDRRQGWTIFGAMAAVLVVGALVAMHNEVAGNPLFPAGIDQALGNMEGKETRFGSAVGGLFAAVTTGTSTGAINCVARQLPATGWARPAVQHRAWRDHAGRYRRRDVRDARDRRHPGGLHRRPDGRPDARIPGQEGRSLRDQDGDARPPSSWAPASLASPPSPGCSPRVWPGRSTRARTASARSCTRSRARRATTARPSPA